MPRHTHRKIIRAIGLATALLIGMQAAPALAQSSESESIRNRVTELTLEYPGSAFVYVACRAMAEGAYKSDQSVSNGLATLAACGAAGCTLTDKYSDCVAVDAELFLLNLRLEALS